MWVYLLLLFNKFRVDCDYFNMHGFIMCRLIVGWYVKVIIIVLQFSPGAFDIFQVDIVVGTPGRLDDLVSTGKLNLSQVRFLVLDEAVCWNSCYQICTFVFLSKNLFLFVHNFFLHITNISLSQLLNVNCMKRY